MEMLRGPEEVLAIAEERPKDIQGLEEHIRAKGYGAKYTHLNEAIRVLHGLERCGSSIKPKDIDSGLANMLVDEKRS